MFFLINFGAIYIYLIFLGRAWNNAGVVECSFPYLKAELTGAKDLGGQIQILQYKGDHNTLGYWYEWIKYKDRFEKPDERQLLKCGDSLPIFWKDRAGGPLVGFLDNKTEEARFSHDGIAESVSLPFTFITVFISIFLGFWCSSC